MLKNLLRRMQPTLPATVPSTPAAEILPGRAFFKDRSHAAYQVLKHYPPGLMVDCGAAAGYTANLMLRASPASRVHAFEPFPGNHRFFKETTAGDDRVKLDSRAVSDRNGQSTFVIPSSVSGTEAGWQSMTGYSSLGALGGAVDGQVSIKVDTCRLDEVFDERIRFLKIDTQGAELKVLTGCEKLFARELIDVMFVEFDGKRDVVTKIIDSGFTLIDTECVLVIEKDATPDAWDIIRSSSLSTGLQTKIAWPRDHIGDPYLYADFLREERRRLGKTWTDLVCVSRSALPRFLFAAGKRDAEVAENFAVSIKDKVWDIL